jgi:hypothetical protein
MERSEWGTLVKSGQAPAHACLRKGLAHPAKQVEGIPNALEFVISDDSVDRDKDVISLTGWKLENYRANPVVLVGHDYAGLSVAQAVDVVVRDRQLIAIDQFAVDEFELAKVIHALYRGRFMRATSVGFDPMEWMFDETRGGYNFNAQELLEHSMVAVPANANALIRAASEGINVKALKTYAESLLDRIDGPGGWVKRADAEAMYRVVRTEKAWSIPLGKDAQASLPETIALSVDGGGNIEFRRSDSEQGKEAPVASNAKDLCEEHPVIADGLTAFLPKEICPDCSKSEGATAYEKAHTLESIESVRVASARLGEKDIPAADLPAIRRFIGQHYRSLGEVAPWDRSPESWDGFVASCAGLRRSMKAESLPAEKLVATLRLFGFAKEADAIAAEEGIEIPAAADTSTGADEPVIHVDGQPLTQEAFRAELRELVATDVLPALAEQEQSFMRRATGRLD